LAATGHDPLPGFTPPTESRWGEAANRFPLELLPRKADNYMNSTFANLDGHRKMEARTNGRLEIHPTDAAPATWPMATRSASSTIAAPCF